jgi:hypothetical protein
MFWLKTVASENIQLEDICTRGQDIVIVVVVAVVVVVG